MSADTYRTSSWLGTGLSSGGAYPPLNVFRKGHIVVIVEVPGVRKAEFQIQVKDNTVRIGGAKSVRYGDNVALHRRERRAGNFDRAVTVPVEIDADRVTAECRHGMPALFLPRAERDKPKSITVR
jgi:HSP20 family protein